MRAFYSSFPSRIKKALRLLSLRDERPISFRGTTLLSLPQKKNSSDTGKRRYPVILTVDSPSGPTCNFSQPLQGQFSSHLLLSSTTRQLSARIRKAYSSFSKCYPTTIQLIAILYHSYPQLSIAILLNFAAGCRNTIHGRNQMRRKF